MKSSIPTPGNNASALTFDTYDASLSVWIDKDDAAGLVQIAIENKDIDGEGSYSYTEMAMDVSQIDDIVEALLTLKAIASNAS